MVYADDVQPTDPLVELIETCASQRVRRGCEQYWWNEFLLYSRPRRAGTETLLQAVVRLLVQRLSKDGFTPTAVLAASPEAQPLAAAVHMVEGIPLLTLTATRIGKVWLTPQPGDDDRVLVVDSLLRSGAAAAEARRLLWNGEGSAYYGVLVDFSTYYRTETRLVSDHGWGGSFVSLLRATREGWIRRGNFERNCRPIDDMDLLPSWTVQDFLTEWWRKVQQAGPPDLR